MRKMAEIVRVGEINKHPNADTLSIAQIHGWNVIIRDGDYAEGDLAVFLQQDAWVPYGLAPFLKKGDSERVYNGIPGDRVRAIKLRGVISNGLLLPYSVLSNHPQAYSLVVGDDVSEFLSIQKWESPRPACLAGEMKGTFPIFIRKTDQIRIESCWEDFLEHRDEFYRVEHKMDGSSVTIYRNRDEIGVCSRNRDLKIDQDRGNAFVDTAKVQGFIDALEKLDLNIAIQGELCGPGIQKNIHGLSGHVIFVFDVWDIDAQTYMRPSEREQVLNKLRDAGAQISEVHAFENSINLREEQLDSIHALKKFVDRSFGKTKCIEGMVFKSRDSDFTFKVINDSYLLKYD